MLRILLLQGAGFGIVGLALAYYLNLMDAHAFQLSFNIVFWSIGLTGLLILLAIGSMFVFPTFMAGLDADLARVWRTMNVQLTPTTIVLLSLSAGIGEELLCRAAGQGYLMTLTPAWMAIMITSLIFGALHALSKPYFIAAVVISLVLGTAYSVTGSLLVVIFAHTAYDIWAFRRLSKLLSKPSETHETGDI